VDPFMILKNEEIIFTTGSMYARKDLALYNEFIDFFQVQLKMPGKIEHHNVKRNVFVCRCDPFVPEFFRINIFYDMCIM